MAVGAGITAFLVVSVSVIELLDVEFSAIVGLPVGLGAGVAASALTVMRHEGLSDGSRWLVAGVAGFGYGVMMSLAVTYVNLVEMGLEERVGLAFALALVAFLAAAVSDRRERPE